jgi:hypothetical protein
MSATLQRSNLDRATLDSAEVAGQRLEFEFDWSRHYLQGRAMGSM